MDFNGQPGMRKSSAKAMMTCPLCSQYFNDPRLLPCGHTFCRRCLQKYFDLKQSGSSIRVGRINCPKCMTMIGIPMSGVEGFPVDKKIGRIKDLVINELAENISKRHQSRRHSDTPSSPSDCADSGDVREANADIFQKHSDFIRSRDRYSRSDTLNDGFDRTTSNSSGFSASSFYPNMTKYAKYFVKDDETEGLRRPHFRPSVRAERQRVGYSSSFQHRRRRVSVEPPKGFDDASDVLQQSKYRSAPRVDSDISSNVSSSYSDVFGQMPRSPENPPTAHNFSSKTYANYSASREHHGPGSSSKFRNDGFREATASLSKAEDERATGVGPGVAYSFVQNKKDKFHSSSGVGKTNFTSSNGCAAQSRGSWKVSEETQRKNSHEANSRPESSSDGKKNFPRAEFMEKDSTSRYSNSNEKTRASLPTRRLNIVASSTIENDKPSQGVDIGKGLHSRSRATIQSHSEYYDAKPRFPPMETKREPTINGKNSENKTSSSQSFAPRSSTFGRSRINKMSDGLYNECKAEVYSDKAALQKEKVHGWYQDCPESKKFDDNFIRTKPDNSKIPKNFQMGENSPKHHKSVRFHTDYWQKSGDQGGDYLKNGKFMTQSRRRACKNVNRSSSVGNLNQFDGCIKFELKKRINPRKKLTDQMTDESQDDSEDEYESEMEQRFAFNERILNMRMNKFRYEDIMSDFKNGNLCSEINLNDDSVDEWNYAEDSDERVVSDGEVITEHSESLLGEDFTKKLKNSTGNMGNSKVKAKSAPTTPKKAETAKEKPAPEEVGCNLKEMIETMRAKYQTVDVDDPSTMLESVMLQPCCCDTVVPKWNFQKTEFAIPTAIAITSKGCTIVADYGNGCLEFFDSEGNYEHKVDGVKPFDIVINNLDLVIVGDRKGKAIRIFDEFGADVSQWEAGLFGWISGLAVLPNGNVVVHDRDRCKIGIYSSGGEKINEFASYGVQNSQLCMADFLTVDSKNRIIVADSGNHCLKLFDTDGKFINKIAHRGTEDGSLEWPKGVCVDSTDNIIVADSQNNRVSMFSATGQFVQHLITTTPSPYSVCFSLSTKLLGVTHYALTGFSQYDVYQCLQ